VSTGNRSTHTELEHRVDRKVTFPDKSASDLSGAVFRPQGAGPLDAQRKVEEACGLVVWFRLSGHLRPDSQRRILVCSLVFAFIQAAPAQAPEASPPINPAAALPAEPVPTAKLLNSNKSPCRVVPASESVGVALVSTTAAVVAHNAGIALPQTGPRSPQSEPLSSSDPAEPPPCPPSAFTPFSFSRFIAEPHTAPLTPRQKADMAFRNFIDPFNAITILGTAAYSVGTDPHSPYGPGLKGFAKNVGVAYTEDLTGEFFGVFLIPSIVHQDPRYYRMPHGSIPRRVLNSIIQVYWSHGDDGKGMPNYANFIGFAINAEITNLYVPGIETDRSSTAQRYLTGLASAPIDNFITEFLPDVASKIHIRVVLVQRIINQVAKTDPASAP
jgi:hypothetical protein